MGLLEPFSNYCRLHRVSNKLTNILWTLLLNIALPLMPLSLPSSSFASTQNNQIRSIAQPEVYNYVQSLFRSPLVSKLAKQPRNIIHDLIKEVSKYPLFVFEPSNDPASRLNFTVWYRLLSLRHTQYSDTLMGDLYLLHELKHMASMPYLKLNQGNSDFNIWQTKIILNEKESTVFSEALIHIVFPELRKAFWIPEIWVDRFIDYSTTSHITSSRAPHSEVLLPSSIKKIENKLISSMLQISSQPYSALDPIEARTWIYDRANEMWTHVYWSIAHEVETQMRKFYKLAETDPQAATEDHLAWLSRNTTNGLTFEQQAREFFEHNKILYELSTKVGKGSSLDRLVDEIEASGEKLDHLVTQGKVEPNASLPVTKKFLHMGITGTVYSLAYPETRETTTKQWRESEFNDLYGEAYTRKQDIEHKHFIEAYRNWSSPVLRGLDEYQNAYYTNGSSEAIVMTLAFMKAQNPELVINVFEGEYEGIAAYARDLNITLHQHPRNEATLTNLKTLCKTGEVFYITQPSSLDGNVWSKYDKFMQITQEAGLRILVDLTYVGAVAKQYAIRLDYPHIEAAFFSLSKIFGVYYQRIGGVFSRKAIPLLFGNIWFKNILSIRIGTELLKRYSVFQLPRKYLWAQKASVLQLQTKLSIPVNTSDVILLANSPLGRFKLTEQDIPDLKGLIRGSGPQATVRYCLTPSMDKLLNSNCQSYLTDTASTEK